MGRETKLAAWRSARPTSERGSAERNGWFVGRFLLMPDHVYFSACPSATAMPRAEWLKLWDSLAARILIKKLGVVAPLWQADTCDHILRSVELYAEKWNYVRENPVRAALIAKSDDWPWRGQIHRLAFEVDLARSGVGSPRLHGARAAR